MRIPFVFKQFILLTVVVLFIYPAISSMFTGDSVIIINPGDNGPVPPWDGVLDRGDLDRWSRAMGFSLIEDCGPVTDNRAGFISRFGTKLTLKGLDRFRKYRMWIDFVRFSGGRTLSLPTSLKLYISSPGGGEELVKEFHFSDLLGKCPAVIDVPYEYSVRGSVIFTLKESSYGASFWGIWDIIISDRKEPPDLRHIEKEKKIEVKYPGRI